MSNKRLIIGATTVIVLFLCSFLVQERLPSERFPGQSVASEESTKPRRTTFLNDGSRTKVRSSKHRLVVKDRFSDTPIPGAVVQTPSGELRADAFGCAETSVTVGDLRESVVRLGPTQPPLPVELTQTGAGDEIKLFVDAFCRIVCELHVADEEEAHVSLQMRAWPDPHEILGASTLERARLVEISGQVERYRRRLADLGWMPHPDLDASTSAVVEREADVEALVPFDGRVLITATSRSGHVPTHAVVAARRGSEARAPINLRRRARVRGVVLDEHGEPVRDATVFVSTTRKQELSRPLRRVREPGNEAMALVHYAGNSFHWMTMQRRTTTDRRGRFHVRMAQTSELVCACFHERLGADVVQSRSQAELEDHLDIELRLRLGPRNWVRLQDTAGEPISNHGFAVQLARGPAIHVEFPPISTDGYGWLDTSLLSRGQKYLLIPSGRSKERQAIVVRRGEVVTMNL